MSENIFIINSYMWFHSFYSSRLPANGETVTGTGYRPSGGGKGANQAFAAAYEGARVELVGRVGNDEPGRVCCKECRETGVKTSYLQLDQEAGTGCGCILRDDSGGNAIVIYPGAGDRFCIEDLEAAEEYVRTCRVGGFQFEVNVDAVFQAIRRTSEWGVETFVDPAPATPIPDQVYPCITYIKPNEHEAAVLTGIQVTDRESATRAGRWLLEKGVQRAAIITLGGQGCMVVAREQERFYPALPVEVEDATCAGDSVAAGFMAALAEGKTLEEAVHRATVLAALTVSRTGSMYNCFFDSREQYQALWKRYQNGLNESQFIN